MQRLRGAVVAAERCELDRLVLPRGRPLPLYQHTELLDLFLGPRLRGLLVRIALAAGITSNLSETRCINHKQPSGLLVYLDQSSAGMGVNIIACDLDQRRFGFLSPSRTFSERAG